MFSSPFLAMRKLFPFAGFSVVVWPVIVPSSTDQWLRRPAQPVRSLPLNRLLKPGSTSWANRRWVGRRTAALKMSAPADLAMRVMRLQLPTLVSTASEKRLVFSLSSPKGERVGERRLILLAAGVRVNSWMPLSPLVPHGERESAQSSILRSCFFEHTIRSD